MDRRPDYRTIDSFFEELASNYGMQGQRALWTRYFYHVTDVHNAVSILSHGLFMSRNLARQRGVMKVDNASADIIGQTRPEVHDSARFYFRPRTPTFYSNEGVRPLNQREHNAHCPVPVAFLLDARAVATLNGTRFSNGNLASARADIGDSVDFLQAIPFDVVFHDTSFTPDLRDEIVFRRNAEVIFAHSLNLDPLRYIITRSTAEYETFVALLEDENPGLVRRFAPITRVNTRVPVFFNKWSYVEQVDAFDRVISVSFNPSSITPGPFRLHAELLDEGRSCILETEVLLASTRRPWQWLLPISVDHRRFRIILQLDDSISYVGDFEPDAGAELA